MVTQHGSDAVLDGISGLSRMEELIFTASSPSDGGLCTPRRIDRVEVSGPFQERGHRRRPRAIWERLTGLRWLIVKNCPVGDTGLLHYPELDAPSKVSGSMGRGSPTPVWCI